MGGFLNKLTNYLTITGLSLKTNRLYVFMKLSNSMMSASWEDDPPEAKHLIHKLCLLCPSITVWFSSFSVI